MSYPLNQSSIASAPIASLMAINIKPPRDDCWLQVQICREFLRGECIRGASGCKFAHPPPALKYDSGRVKVCYDHLKNKCKRSECKYFHTPQHLSQEVLKVGKERMEGKREAEQLAKAAQELVAMPLPPLPQLNPYQHILPLYNPYSSALIERALALTGQVSTFLMGTFFWEFAFFVLAHSVAYASCPGTQCFLLPTSPIGTTGSLSSGCLEPSSSGWLRKLGSVSAKASVAGSDCRTVAHVASHEPTTF
ncbi:unnamed protein product [Caenorhabditis brenneri]